MNNEVSFTIYDKPTPLKRHRHTSVRHNHTSVRHNHTCTYHASVYDPQKDDKDAYRILIQHDINQHNPHFDGSYLDGPLHVTLRFYFKLPKTKKLRNSKGLYHHQKPDLDNLIKFILDVMNSYIYKDDSQIFKIDAIKCYTPNQPRTDVTIKEVTQADIIQERKNDKDPKEKQNTFFPARIAK